MSYIGRVVREVVFVPRRVGSTPKVEPVAPIKEKEQEREPVKV